MFPMRRSRTLRKELPQTSTRRPIQPNGQPHRLQRWPRISRNGTHRRGPRRSPPSPTQLLIHGEQRETRPSNGRRGSTGFSLSLIRSALIRPSNSNVYISARKSMTVRVFIHSNSKRAETISLLDSRATENFLNLDYAKWLRLPIKRLPFPRKLFNIDGTENKAGQLQFYTDLAIHTKREEGETEQQHLERHRLYTHHMLHKLEQNDLYLKPKKCDFEKKEIDYLGVIVSNSRIQMDPKKLKGVADWPVPRNPTEIRKFLGFTGYYRYFVQGYSKIARPLLDLTKKAVVWHWGEPQ